MPATINDILRTKPELVTTTPDKPLYDALELMLHYDYSQLPVLNAGGTVVGMISSDSVMRALHHFGLSARGPKDDNDKGRHLRVQDAMMRDVQTCGPETEVFKVHRQLRDASGVLVVNDSGRLIGIITGYDTTEYLRQRVQDIVFVQDIEERIKDYARLAFRNSDGSEDSEALKKAVAQVLRAESSLGKHFRGHLEAYLKRKEGDSAQVDEAVLAEVLGDMVTLKNEPDFDDLSLAQYVQLFMRHGYPKYGHVFQLERKYMTPLLESVTQTRNDLAHLRIEITARQRDELRICREWLVQYIDEARAVIIKETAVESTAPTNTNVAPAPDVAAYSTNGEEPVLERVEELTGAGESRYAALADWLYALAADQHRITLSLGQIEQIIGGALPQSAREYRAWWANDTSRQQQASQWLSAGWRTDDVDLTRGLITFSRIQPRERAYIDFFESLIGDLRGKASFKLLQPTQVGYYWQSVARVPERSPIAGYLTFSFTRNRRPRVDLYIDTGDRAKNKQIFDALYARRASIEEAYGGTLDWERSEEKRASRIAVYYDGPIDISATPEELAALRGWGVDTLLRLKRALDEPVREVMGAPVGRLENPAAPSPVVNG